MANSLSSAENWCEVLPLHLNVKACTFAGDGESFTVYLGKKTYQDAEQAHELTYQFSTTQREDYFAAEAVADKGPMGTSDYHIEFEILKIDGKSFGRIHVSDHQSWISSKAMSVYLSTKGKDKQGITVVDHDEQGNPVYSTGEAAVAERNLLRYYFAFQAYFDSIDLEDSRARHEAQLQYWFEQTEAFQQLHELDKKTYLEEKRKERENQIKLQKEVLQTNNR